MIQPRHHWPQACLHSAIMDPDFDDVEGAALELVEAVATHGAIALALDPAAPVTPRSDKAEPHV